MHLPRVSHELQGVTAAKDEDGTQRAKDAKGEGRRAESCELGGVGDRAANCSSVVDARR